ncbi:MAG TPA: HAD-IIIA family hydrolase [Acidobacteriaceae bacterium]|jgi:D-glycero-D-manno-heptose 1,7-bisphosphate phosphatase|nr:HAD-IIIA family hydrolase [Acidobacteriaceae bacterium]
MGIGEVARPAIFLDRDGVLNALVLNPATGRMESPLIPEDFRLLPGVIPALRRLQACGYALILVSNQPNYALGKSTWLMSGLIHHKLVTELVGGGVHFARFCYCLHHPKGVLPGYVGLCPCRKPSPWFLLRARDDFDLSLAHSWMIGDQATDTACGRAAGVRTLRIDLRSGSDAGTQLRIPDPCADAFASDLAEAAEIVLAR